MAEEDCISLIVFLKMGASLSKVSEADKSNDRSESKAKTEQNKEYIQKKKKKKKKK